MKKNDLMKAISKYFLEFLPKNSGLSENTIKSYRDTFVLYLRFYQESSNKISYTFECINRKSIEAFLCWLETERGYAISSRNQRLAAFRSFMKYIQVEYPEYILKGSEILNIRMKKTPQPEISFLSVEAIKYLLSIPDITFKNGQRDLALIMLLYDSGARVQELADLTQGDIRCEKPASVTLTGKGRKTRVIPIMQQTADLINNYKSKFEKTEQTHPLFYNRKCEKLTRGGITYILKKYVAEAKKVKPELYPHKVTPHTLRHSKAMHLLESEVNLIYIRDFLGHKSVVTTETYAKVNPEVKRKAIGEISADILPEEHYTQDEKKDMINWLKSIL
ncbi:MAG: tyrosine-type recombinase/integrase [Lachnospiraceae bacterium]